MLGVMNNDTAVMPTSTIMSSSRDDVAVVSTSMPSMSPAPTHTVGTLILHIQAFDL